MRGPDDQTSGMFSYLSPEQRVRPDHPLRAIRRMTDEVFATLSPRRWYGATPWTCGHGGVGITHGGSRGHGQTDGPVECSGAPGRHYPIPF